MKKRRKSNHNHSVIRSNSVSGWRGVIRPEAAAKAVAGVVAARNGHLGPLPFLGGLAAPDRDAQPGRRLHQILTCRATSCRHR